MKYLTGKITLSLLATTLSLSAKDPTLPYSILDMEQSMLQESAEPDLFTPKGAEKLTDPNLLISRSPNRAGALENALCSSSLTKKEFKTLKKIYKLLEDYATLSEEAKKLKLENAELKAENDSLTKKELKTLKKIYKQLLEDYATLSEQELKTLKKIYKQLLEDYATLSEEVKKLKLENAELKAENDAYKEEKKSTWERLKNWFFKLDTTKVLASVASGTFTLIAALLAILF